MGIDVDQSIPIAGALAGFGGILEVWFVGNGCFQHALHTSDMF